MDFETFDKIADGLTRLSRVKIRDSKSPIPRGYSLRWMDDCYLLISIDGAINVRFFGYKESLIIPGVVDLYAGDMIIGAVSIKDMEVEE